MFVAIEVLFFFLSNLMRLVFEFIYIKNLTYSVGWFPAGPEYFKVLINFTLSRFYFIKI